MKVLSVQQPFASELLCNWKIVENRSWNTSHRGSLLIHASGPAYPLKNHRVFNEYHKMPQYPDDIPGYDAKNDCIASNAIIGSVELLDVIPNESLPDDNQNVVRKDLDRRIRKLFKEHGLPVPKHPSAGFEYGEDYYWICGSPCFFCTPIKTKGKPKLWDYMGDIGELIPYTYQPYGTR
jgi:hypothetical protein